MFRDLSTGKIYTRWQLFKKWFALDEGILEKLEKNGITCFDEWLEMAIGYGRLIEEVEE